MYLSLKNYVDFLLLGFVYIPRMGKEGLTGTITQPFLYGMKMKQSCMKNLFNFSGAHRSKLRYLPGAGSWLALGRKCLPQSHI
jgi:hypothetical protein